MSANGSLERGAVEPRGTNLVLVLAVTSGTHDGWAPPMEGAGECENGSNVGAAAACVKAWKVDDMGCCALPDEDDASDAKGSKELPCPVHKTTEQQQRVGVIW